MHHKPSTCDPSTCDPSLLSSVYQSKAFTKYAVYTALAYGVTRNPKVGLLALNCNTASTVMMNYVRFLNPVIYGRYKVISRKHYEMSELSFQAGDILVHILPLSLMVYSRKYWYHAISYRSTVTVSIASFLLTLAWAYHYSSGINVCKAYDVPEESSTISAAQWKRVWCAVFLCHNVTAIQKTVRLFTSHGAV